MTDITRTDYPTDPIEGTPVETPPNTWVPTDIDVYPWLGYNQTYKNRHTGIGTSLISTTDSRIVAVHRLVAWLQYWDSQLRDMVTTGMANEVGSLKLDFVRGAAMVKNEASRTLYELATLLDIPVWSDKYHPRQKSQPFQVTSLL